MDIRRNFHHIGTVCAVVVAMAGTCAFAGEYGVLASGFRIHADRHELDGDHVKFYTKDGVTEMPCSAVTGYEQEEYTAPAVPEIAAAPVPAQANGALTTKQLIESVAKKHGLPAAFVASVVAVESAYRPQVVSPKGAIGLMQLMPGTAKQFGVDARVPEQNVEAGTQYLRSLLAKYEDRDDQVLRALAAYNAGPGAVDKYHGVPPYRETRDYIWRVLRNYDKLKN